MMRVPDPMWKTNPDYVADCTFGERFLPDDELDEDEFEEEDDYFCGWDDRII